MLSSAGNEFRFQKTPVPVSCRQSRPFWWGNPVLAWPLVIALFSVSTVRGQSPETPMTRLRPITASSAVDQIAREQGQQNLRETDRPDVTQVDGRVVTAQWESTPFDAVLPIHRETPAEIRHTAMMQFQLPAGSDVPTMAPPVAPSDASMIPPPSLGPSGPPVSGTVLGPSSPPASTTFAPAPTTMSPPPMSPTYQGAPTMAPPRGLPMSPGMTIAPPMGTTTVPGSRDLLPVAPPQLSDQFATIDNCSCVSPPSGYVAATGWTQPSPSTSFVATPAPSAYIAPTAPVAAPVAGVPAIPDASTMPKGSGVPRHSVISFGQDRNPVVVGQGIVGQPVAYVPGQPVRNWIRYIFP